MMSGIRAKNTRPEIFLRQRLHALGFRFRLHGKGIPGKPDIVLPKYQALIMVHGCFWHGHGCRYFKVPKSNTAFWMEKISANRTRDQKNMGHQRDGGWRTLVVWECGIRADMRSGSKFDIAELSASWLRSRSKSASIDEQGIKEI